MAIRRRRGRELVAVKRKLLAEGSDVWRGDGAGAASEASRASLGDAPSDLPDSSLSVDGSGGEGKGKRARVQAVSAASAVVTGPALGSLARETPTKRPGRAGRGAALASSARRRAILPRTHERVKSEGGQMTLVSWSCALGVWWEGRVGGCRNNGARRCVCSELHWLTLCANFLMACAVGGGSGARRSG